MSLKLYRVTSIAVAVGEDDKSPEICRMLSRAELIVDDSLIYDRRISAFDPTIQWIKEHESKRLLILCADIKSAEKIVESIWPASGPRMTWPNTVIHHILEKSPAVFRVYSFYAQKPVRLFKIEEEKLVEVTPETLEEESRTGEGGAMAVAEDKTKATN